MSFMCWSVRINVAVLTLLNRDKPLQLLTKGDNNLADDTELYAKGQDYLKRSGHYWQRRGLYSLRGLCHNPLVGTPLVEDGSIRPDGCHGSLTKGIEWSIYLCPLRTSSTLCNLAQPSRRRSGAAHTNYYGLARIGPFLTLPSAV